MLKIDDIKLQISQDNTDNTRKWLENYLKFLQDYIDSNIKVIDLISEDNNNRMKMERMFHKHIKTTIGDLFKITGNGKTNDNEITNTGEYPFYAASCDNPVGTHSNYDFDGKEYLLIIKSRPNSKMFIVNGKCAASRSVYQLIPKTNNNTRYLYHYLNSIQDRIQHLRNYYPNDNINLSESTNLKILIAPIEQQQKIADYCDENNRLIENLKNQIEKNKKLSTECFKHLIT